MKTTVYTHPAGLAHDTGTSHPERGERLQVLQQLLEQKDFRDLDIVEPDKATDKQLGRAHTSDYIEHVRESSPEKDRIYLDYGDTVMSPGSLDAALYAAGAVCQAVDDVLTFKTRRAFCMNRPPGHHAEPDRALGFCLFNSIFVGAMQAIAQYDCNKVVIVDFDVHHGNGTDTMTRQEEHTFYISTHEWPLFPGTGNPDHNSKHRIMNETLPNSSGSKEFRQKYEDIIIPEIESYAPDLIMVSAGFDAHARDSISSIQLENDDYKWISEKLVALANTYCEGRIISVLEGGYDLQSLQDGVAAHLKAFMV